MNLLVSAIAVTFGIFAASSPLRAAEIWGWNHLHRLSPAQRVLYLRVYRAFGVVLCLGGVLFAVDSLLFAKYHH
jgi:hypothetical protein